MAGLILLHSAKVHVVLLTCDTYTRVASEPNNVGLHRKQSFANVTGSALTIQHLAWLPFLCCCPLAVQKWTTSGRSLKQYLRKLTRKNGCSDLNAFLKEYGTGLRWTSVTQVWCGVG